MSSKSKNKAQKSSAPAKHADPKQGDAGEEHGLGERVEEVLDVPTGRSPMRFLLTVLFIIVLTAMFAINPGTINQATSGSGEVFLTWNHPSKGKVEVLGRDFMYVKRDLALFGSRPTDQDVARHLILSDLAQDAGVRVTDDDLRDQLVQMAASAGDAQVLKQYMRQATGGIRGFEELIRDQIAGQRYLQLLAYFSALPDPDAVEEAWREAHQELAYDYVALPVADVLDDARAEVPSDEELETWLAERDEIDMARFEEPARVKAELAGYLIGGENDAAGLLERYPDPGHGDEEEVEEHDHEGDIARAYYDRVLYWRFAKPVGEDEDEPLDFQSRYYDFEEVEELCRAEAPVHAALERWMGDLRERRNNDEEIDLEAEATELGLSYRPAGELLSPDEWNEVEGWGGDTLGARLGRLQPDELTPTLMVGGGSLAVGRVLERTEAYLPEFAEIRDDVAEAWAEDRAKDLAVERLAALRDGFEPKPADEDEEPDDDGEEDPALPWAEDGAFASAVAGAGYEIRQRPFMERRDAFTADPDSDLAAHRFIRTTPGLDGLEEGELAEPSLGDAGETAFLVRCAGRRPAEAWRMTPAERDQSVMRAGFENYAAFIEANFSYASLVARYGADMPLAEEPEPEG